MADHSPAACSLSPDDLQDRLREIAAVAAERLIAYGTEEDRHLLRFRGSDETRRRLEALVEAESRCCSFLELSLEERGDTVTLSISRRA